MRRPATLLLPLALAGCGTLSPGLQTGLETAGTIADTAAVVRARQLGLCGEPTHRPLATPEDVLQLQEDIEELKADLARVQGELTRRAIERARRQAANPFPPAVLPASVPTSSTAPAALTAPPAAPAE